MKFPELFKRERSTVAAREAQDRTEKLLAEGFRVLSHICTQVADFIESQRLQRAGYPPQEKYLQRLDDRERPASPEAAREPARKGGQD